MEKFERIYLKSEAEVVLVDLLKFIIILSCFFGVNFSFRALAPVFMEKRAANSPMF